MHISKPNKAVLMRELKDYVMITLGLISYSLAWAAFLIPYQITTGGTTGIGAIIYYATGFPIQWSYFLINAVLMTFAIKILGPKFSIKTTYAIFMLTFFLWLFQKIVNGPDGIPPQILGPGQEIGASMCGLGLGVVFNCNGSTGGTDIIAAIINKYRDVTLGRMIMACDVVIISSCYFIFHDWRRVIFGFVTLFVIGFVLDYIVVRHRLCARLHCEQCPPVGPVPHLLQRIREDSRPYHQGNPSRRNGARRYRLVQQRSRQGTGSPSLQAPVGRNLPPGQGHRPQCFHLAKLGHRCIW